jgi:hypothetical protein
VKTLSCKDDYEDFWNGYDAVMGVSLAIAVQFSKLALA